MHDTLGKEQIYVAVDLLILTEHAARLKLLLSRRPQEPFSGRWALPGRFVGMDESAETSAQLLLMEMLGTQKLYMEQLYTFTDIHRDPRGRVISIAYLVVVPWKEMDPLLREHAEGYQLCDVETGRELLRITDRDGREMQEADFAFDHERIVRTGIQRIQGKLNYTPIGFAFLNDPEGFSLSEVQEIHEAILGYALDPSNFRRQMLKQYEESGTLSQTEKTEIRRRGRPAALYQWKDRRQTQWQTENS
ncbi:MAG: NUDIX domain-containing protein [Clostridia bacterium]|nr:NUDIX domain-containing protein [Clostridia bacterium]